MAGCKETLSLGEARKLVLLSQKLPPAGQKGPALEATLRAVEHLGYVQIDTISVVRRAHHHTLWNRNPRYKEAHLDRLLEEKRIFEYWSHAAAYLPMKDYRYSLPRKTALAREEEHHWYMRDYKLMESVLKRISDEGPLMVKDFGNGGEKIGVWGSNPNKRALENLFMQGVLMVPRRQNFHKVYDLTERVLPPGTDTSLPDIREYTRFLITRFLRANGLGRATEIAYLLKSIRPAVEEFLREMGSDGELIRIKAAGEEYYALPESLELLKKPLARNKLKILSPFDNLLIQRKRMKELFGFDYQIECYVPAAKRKYGYFSLPLLWNGELVARMDCKAESGTSVLHVKSIVREPGLKRTDDFRAALEKEIVPFMRFNNCTAVEWHA